MFPLRAWVGCQLIRRVADHSLYASQAEVKHFGEEQLSFAVVGNVRDALPALDRRAGRHGHGGITAAIVQSLSSSMGQGGPEFVVFTGDMVTQGQEGAWQRWDETWAPVLQGHTLPSSGSGDTQVVRVPSQPVMGDHDGLMDRRYRGAGGLAWGEGAHWIQSCRKLAVI